MTRPQRIAGQPPEDWSEATREVLATATSPGQPAPPPPGGAAPPPTRPLHLPSVVAHHPALLAPYMGWARSVALDGVLSRRANALLALRTAWHCRSEFEWGVHAETAARMGLGRDEIERVAAGPAASGWSADDAALLQAADELHREQTVSDDTWRALSANHGTAALLEIVFVVGHYTMLSMVANSAGIPPEPGWMALPPAG